MVAFLIISIHFTPLWKCKMFRTAIMLTFYSFPRDHCQVMLSFGWVDCNAPEYTILKLVKGGGQPTMWCSTFRYTTLNSDEPQCQEWSILMSLLPWWPTRHPGGYSVIFCDHCDKVNNDKNETSDTNE